MVPRPNSHQPDLVLKPWDVRANALPGPGSAEAGVSHILCL